MAPGTFRHTSSSCDNQEMKQPSQNPLSNSETLDKTFQKMEKLGIPADVFGNINPNWRIVMKKYFDLEKDLDQHLQHQFDKVIQNISEKCEKKYGQKKEQLQDCYDQSRMKIISYFQKPKQISEILLCNFANKCLIRGNTVDFCLDEVLKQKKVINAESLKKLQNIHESI